LGNNSRLTRSVYDDFIAPRFSCRDVDYRKPLHIAGATLRLRACDGAPPSDDHGVDPNAQGEGKVTEQRLYQLIRQSHDIKDRTLRDRVPRSWRSGVCVHVRIMAQRCTIRTISRRQTMQSFLPLLLVFQLTPTAYAAELPGDSADGKRLHDANCMGCHDTGVYSRADHQVTSLDALKEQLVKQSYGEKRILRD
jgi:hypothetical protein